MIGQIKGQIISKNPPEVLLEVGGIGYELLCPMSTFYQLDNLSEDTLLYTHLSIKEDSHTLFGFISKDEKNMFRELIRVNGVGPKVALAILSHLSVSSLVDCIMSEDAVSVQASELVALLQAKGVTVEEMAGAALAMRERASAIAAPKNAIDTCSTGGNGISTFNISTCAAIIAAAAGAEGAPAADAEGAAGAEGAPAAGAEGAPAGGAAKTKESSGKKEAPAADKKK